MKNTMWLPTPVYERIPEFWILMGLLFFSLGLYIGFDFSLTFLYLAVGAACFIRGIWVQVMRLRHRSNTPDASEP
jgi:uncharacterized membrane protein HdeD (DUF308 family)